MTVRNFKLHLATATAALVLGMVAIAPASAQPVPADLTTMPPVPTDYVPDKTPWGDPDLRGTFPIDNIASLFMTRMPQFGDRFWLTEEEDAARKQQADRSTQAYQAEEESGKMGMGHWVESDASGRRTSLLVSPANGQFPEMTQYGKDMMAIGRSSWVAGQTYDWVSDFDSWDRCITRGFPASMFPFRYNNGIRIFQSPGYVVISLEMIHDARVIPIVDKASLAHNNSNVKEWMGDSVGYWEGNTLVVETRNIQPGASPLNMATMGVPPNNVIPMTDDATVTERLTMTEKNHIIYELTYEDPQVYTAPWTARLDSAEQQRHIVLPCRLPSGPLCSPGALHPYMYTYSRRLDGNAFPGEPILVSHVRLGLFVTPTHPDSSPAWYLSATATQGAPSGDDGSRPRGASRASCLHSR